MILRSKIACVALLLNFFLCPLALAHANSVDTIIELLESGTTHDYIGEPVSQLEHALQCAQLAVDAGADDQTILAALLHDIGHLCGSPNNATMGEYGIDQHEKVGAQFFLVSHDREQIGRPLFHADRCHIRPSLHY